MNRRLLPKAYAALQLYLAVLPLFALPAAALFPNRLWQAVLLPVPALAATFAIGLLPAKRRVPALVVSLLLLGGVCAALFLPEAPLGMLVYLPCAAAMLLFLPAMARPAHREWRVTQLGLGILLQLVAQFVKNDPMFSAVAAPLAWVCAAYLIAAGFSYNRNMLMDNDPAAAKPLLRQNRRLLAGLCLIALLLTNLRAVAAAVRTGIQAVFRAVVAAALWLASLFQPGTGSTTAAPGGNPLEGLPEGGEPGAFSRILEMILYVLAALVLAAAAFFALRALYRLCRRALRALYARLQEYRQRVAADVSDQSDSLLNWEELRAAARTRLHRLQRRYLPTPWEKLTPAQRVRRVYALLLRRGQTPNPAQTAREALSGGAFSLPPDTAQALAALYEEARYSSHPIAQAQADALRKRAGV